VRLGKILVWLILCLIWGSTWIFIKIGLTDLPPISFAAVRFVLSAVIVFAIIRVQKIPLPRSIAEWRLLALTGFLQFALNYSSVFWAEQYISSGLAAVLQAMIPVFGLLLAWIFLPHEQITRQKITAVAIGILGVIVIFADQLRVENWMSFLGCVAIVIGSYCAAQASILVKARAGGIHPAALLFGQMISGLPFILVYSFTVEGNPIRFNWSFVAVSSVLYLSLFGTIAAFWLYYWLLKRVESTNAMMISLVTPLLAVLIGAVTIGETLPRQTFVGGMMIIGSIALIVFRRGIFRSKRPNDAEDLIEAT
jgi:drug/metabolite transporter (DMT)-like permease